MSIGKVATSIILNNPSLSNQELLDLLKKVEPKATKTTTNCIAWYKSDIKKKKIVLPTQERTIEVIELELESYKDKIEELEEELKSKKESSKTKMLEEYNRLKKLLEVE